MGDRNMNVLKIWMVSGSNSDSILLPSPFPFPRWRRGWLPGVARRENAVANELKEFLARHRQIGFRRDGFTDVDFHLAPSLKQMESPGLGGNQLHVLNENRDDGNPGGL